MIHPSAIIDPSARLAQGVSVGAFSIIGADVTVGKNCWIGPHVVMTGPAVFGRENKIYQFSSIGESPQDKKYGGEATLLEVGDRNVIREYVTLNRGTVDGHGKTRIGSDNLFMAYSHVAHDCDVGDFTVFANGASLAGHVDIGDHVTLGGFCLVHQFVRIGAQAFCGMGAVITRDIPPYSIAAGNRARTIGINKVGLKRKGYSTELIRALHTSFRLLIKSKISRDKAMQELQSLIDQHPEVALFTHFVMNSERGITR